MSTGLAVWMSVGYLALSVAACGGGQASQERSPDQVADDTPTDPNPDPNPDPDPDPNPDPSPDPISLGARTPWPMGTQYINSGHSLTDGLFLPAPGHLSAAVLLDPMGEESDAKRATIAGAPIWWRWQNEETTGPSTAQWPEEMPSHQGLVITPAVPLYQDDRSREEDVEGPLADAVSDAWQRGNGGQGAPTLLYTTWTHLRGWEEEVAHPEMNLSFRERLDRDEPRWEGMQDYANARLVSGQTPVYMIPGHRLMMRIYDDIEAGIAPFDAIDDLFQDNIHTNDLGNYALSALHYACIYGRDPVSYLPDRWLNEGEVAPTPAQAQYLKRVVREVVTSYPRTGLTTLQTQ